MADTTKTSLVLSIIAILTAAGIPISQQMISGNEDILNKYYVCPYFPDETTGHLKIYYFDRLSSTKQRGYPNPGTTAGYVDCRLGNDRAEWQTLISYAASLGIDPNTLLESYTGTPLQPPAPLPILSDKCWKCSFIGCEVC